MSDDNEFNIKVLVLRSLLELVIDILLIQSFFINEVPSGVYVRIGDLK